MRLEIHKLRQIFLLTPLIGFDTEYRCVFFAWLNNMAIFYGKGKKGENYD